MIISLAIVSTIFPIVFAIFYTIYTDLTDQLLEHQFYEQYDQFQTQLMRDESNATSILSQGKQLIMTMQDGEQIRYAVSKNKLVRSVRQREGNNFRGFIILIPHVHQIFLQRQGQGVQLTIEVLEHGSLFSGSSYVWGRIDE